MSFSKVFEAGVKAALDLFKRDNLNQANVAAGMEKVLKETKKIEKAAKKGK